MPSRYYYGPIVQGEYLHMDMGVARLMNIPPMMIYPSGRVPGKASRLDHHKTRSATGLKILNKCFCRFQGYIKASTSRGTDRRSRGATKPPLVGYVRPAGRDPRPHGAHRAPCWLMCPLAPSWWETCRNIVFLFSIPKELTFYKYKNMQEKGTGTGHWINSLIQQMSIIFLQNYATII